MGKMVAGSQEREHPNLQDKRVWTTAFTATKIECEERRGMINKS